MTAVRHLFSFPPKGNGDVLVLTAAAAFLGWLFGWESALWQNLILFLAVLVGILSLRSARRTARQKATLAFLREYHNSEEVGRGAKILNQQDGDQPPLDEDQKAAVRGLLNQLELLAVGLKNGIYDEKIVRDAMETTIVRFYNRGKSFVEKARIRDGDVREVAYEHFTNLALKISGQLKKSK